MLYRVSWVCEDGNVDKVDLGTRDGAQQVFDQACSIHEFAMFLELTESGRWNQINKFANGATYEFDDERTRAEEEALAFDTARKAEWETR